MKIGVLAILIMLSMSVFSEEDYDKTVTDIGIQKENTAYFKVSEGWKLNCSYGVMYLETNTDFGKAALSVILTAKSTEKQLARIVYSQSSSGTCQISLVQVK